MSAPTTLDRYPSRLDAPHPAVPRSEPVVWGTVSDGPLEQPALDEMDTRGFIVRPRTVDPLTVNALHGEIDRITGEYGFDPRIIRESASHEVRSIFRVHTMSDLVTAVACSPEILGVAEQLLGGEVYLHQSRINAMPAFRGRGFFWHSDFETWHAEDGLPQMRTVSCSIALSRNLPYNGSLQVIPGTHRTFFPCVGRTPQNNHEQSLVEQHTGVPPTEMVSAAAQSNGIELFLGEPGDALWFDCNLLHGSGSNISPYPRSNLFLVFNSVHNSPEHPFAGTPPRPEHIAARTISPLRRQPTATH